MTTLLDDIVSDFAGLDDLGADELTEVFVRRDRTVLEAGRDNISVATVNGHEVQVTTRMNHSRLARASLLLNNRTGRAPYWSFTTNCKPTALDISIDDGTGKITLQELLRRIVAKSTGTELTIEKFEALLRARNYLQGSMVIITQHNGVLKSVINEFMDFMAENGATDVTDEVPDARRNDLLRVMDFGPRPGLDITRMELGSVDSTRYNGFTDLVNAQLKNFSRMVENQRLRRAAATRLQAAEPGSDEAMDAQRALEKHQRAATTWLNNWGGVNPIMRRPTDAAEDADVEPEFTGDYGVCSVPCADFKVKGNDDGLYDLSVWADREAIAAEMRAERGDVAERMATGALSGAPVEVAETSADEEPS